MCLTADKVVAMLAKEERNWNLAGCAFRLFGSETAWVTQKKLWVTQEKAWVTLWKTLGDPMEISA